MSSSPAVKPEQREELLQRYFSAIAPSYDRVTGNVTRRILAKFLSDTNLKFDALSIIHDNACGNGTATEVILEWCSGRGIFPPTIIATDYNKEMIAAMSQRVEKFSSSAAGRVKPEIMHSFPLNLPTEAFTHVVCNFSVMTFPKPLRAIAEIHRVMRPNGLAVITVWKRFAVGEVMHAAKKAIRGDNADATVKGLGAEFEQEGYLAKMVDQAGFEVSKIRTFNVSDLVKEGDDLDGLVDFMLGDFSKPVRMEFTDEENKKWPDAVKEAVDEEKSKHGGLLFEGWVVLARRWDALYA